MKNNIVIGLLLGVVAGVIDVIPMLLQGLTWDANLSAFFLWVVSGFMLSTSNLKLAPVLRGQRRQEIRSWCLAHHTATRQYPGRNPEPG